MALSCDTLLTSAFLGTSLEITDFHIQLHNTCCTGVRFVTIFIPELIQSKTNSNSTFTDHVIFSCYEIKRKCINLYVMRINMKFYYKAIISRSTSNMDWPKYMYPVSLMITVKIQLDQEYSTGHV